MQIAYRRGRGSFVHTGGDDRGEGGGNRCIVLELRGMMRWVLCCGVWYGAVYCALWFGAMLCIVLGMCLLCWSGGMLYCYYVVVWYGAVLYRVVEWSAASVYGMGQYLFYHEV